MTEISPTSRMVRIQDKSLETLFWRVEGAMETIVLIHEALGSASYWKGFPAHLGRSTCCNVLAYSRAGHGNSDGPLVYRSSDYYEDQAAIVLPSLMREFQIAEPVLYGHSEGSAIAFLYASANASVKAILGESPVAVTPGRALHMVEEMDRAENREELIEKLSRYHRDARAVFESWVQGVRFHLTRLPASAIHLSSIRCPVLVIQGALDPFGGAEQWIAIENSIPDVRRVVLPRSGHLPHREDPQAVIEAATRFLNQPRPSGELLIRENCTTHRTPTT